MINVLKGNRILKVKEDALVEYLEKGYSQIDEKGKVIKKGKVSTKEEINKEIERLEAENKKLREENILLQEEMKSFEGTTPEGTKESKKSTPKKDVKEE